MVNYWFSPMETKSSPIENTNSPMKMKTLRQFPSERICCYYYPLLVYFALFKELDLFFTKNWDLFSSSKLPFFSEKFTFFQTLNRWRESLEKTWTWNEEITLKMSHPAVIAVYIIFIHILFIYVYHLHISISFYSFNFKYLQSTSIYPSVCLSIYPSILFLDLSIYRYIYLYIYIYVNKYKYIN